MALKKMRDKKGRAAKGKKQIARRKPGPEHAAAGKKPAPLGLQKIRRSGQLKEAIFRVSEAVYSAPDLNALFHQMHQIVGELIPARNFYIALYEKVWYVDYLGERA